MKTNNIGRQKSFNSYQLPLFINSYIFSLTVIVLVGINYFMESTSIGVNDLVLSTYCLSNSLYSDGDRYEHNYSTVIFCMR